MPKIAVVVFDTLRKDTFDKFFEWLPGHHYHNVYSTANYTLPAHASMFSGRYPSEVGCHARSENSPLPEASIIDILNSEGYHTISLSENILLNSSELLNQFDELERLGPAKLSSGEIFPWKEEVSNVDYPSPLKEGLLFMKLLQSQYENLLSLKMGYRIWKNTHSEGIDDLISYLSKAKIEDDTFAFINLMTVHDPYYMGESGGDFTHPPPYTSAEQAEGYKTRYKKSANFLSGKYKDVYLLLQSEFDHIITLSDHGEVFGEYEFHTKRLMQHYYGIFPEITQIPIVIQSMKEEITRDPSDPASILEVYNTILDIIGKKEYYHGNSLFEKAETPYLIEHHGIRQGSQSYLERNKVPKDIIEEYDEYLRGVVTSSGYHYEMGSNVTSNDPEEKVGEKKLDKMFSQEIIRNDSKKTNDHIDRNDDNVKQHLKELGYL